MSTVKYMKYTQCSQSCLLFIKYITERTIGTVSNKDIVEIRKICIYHTVSWSYVSRLLLTVPTFRHSYFPRTSSVQTLQYSCNCNESSAV